MNKTFHSSSLVEDGAIIGEGSRIWAFAHILPGAKIGIDCNICDHVFIENDVLVGDRVTVKCGVQLWDGVRLGDDVFVGPNATFTNDKTPRSKQYNEVAELCEQTGADVHAVAKGMGLHARIGKKFLHAGPGYGGSCFPKDTLAMIRMAQEAGASSHIVEAVVAVNTAQKARMVTKIQQAMGGNIAGKSIGVLGLTFKPETDDMRDAPSSVILPALLDQGATVKAHDPQGMDEARRELPDTVLYMDNIEDTVKDADAIVLMTEWNEYRGLDLGYLKSVMRGNVFFDLRNVYEKSRMEAHGFSYSCVGR